MNLKTVKGAIIPWPSYASSCDVFAGFFKLRYSLFILVLVVIFITADAVFAEQLSVGIPLHHFQLSCDNCHDPAPSGGEQNEAQGNVGKIRDGINQSCTQSPCHNYDSALNHPVGIRPTGAVPADMPLDGSSRITCLTCHDSANSSDTSNNVDIEQKHLLIRPAGIKFCSSCHARMGSSLKEQSHWQFSTRAHLGSINPQSTPSKDFAQFIGGIDTESRACLSCHTDISATIPSDDETQREKQLRWKNMSDHPIGMDYRRTAVRNINSYDFTLGGNQQIRLFDGRLGCGSCHSLYAKTQNNLVASSERGILCRNCHNK